MATITAHAAAVGALVCLVSATASADTITLKDALARAEHRPSVQAAGLDAGAAHATAAGAALPAYNPELTLEGGPELNAGTTVLDFSAQLAQTFELGGKREARTREADATATVADRAHAEAVLVARVDAWRAFERAIVLRDRLQTRRDVEQLTHALVAAMQRAAAAGGTTQLRVNVLAADAGRARRDRLAAEADYDTALAQLATAIGAAPGERPEPAGALGALPAPPDETELVATALRDHPEVRAAAAAVDAARATIDVADSRAVPDVTLGLGYAYAHDPEPSHAIVATVAVPLPLRNRNQGQRAASRIEARRAEVDSARVRVELERRIRLALTTYQRARDAVAGFGHEVTDKLHENLTLAQDAFAKGGIDFVELSITRRDLIDARLAFLDAELTAIDAWAELALASGMEVAP